MPLFTRIGQPAALLGAAMLLTCPGAHAEQCAARAITSSTADVYEKPPRFAFGAGWQGTQIERLSSGVSVFVCSEIDLQFGLTTRTWVQIGYRTAGDWRYGWVSKEAVRTAVRTDGTIKRLYASLPTQLQAAAMAKRKAVS
jgi:hypothetical protein